MEEEKRRGGREVRQKVKGINGKKTDEMSKRETGERKKNVYKDGTLE